MNDGINKHGQELRAVQVRLTENTISKVEEIQYFFECNNKTDALVRSVRLTHSIVEALKNGGSIEMHLSNGLIKELKINGR
jgi:hypothetical protein